MRRWAKRWPEGLETHEEGLLQGMATVPLHVSIGKVALGGSDSEEPEVLSSIFSQKFSISLLTKDRFYIII